MSILPLRHASSLRPPRAGLTLHNIRPPDSPSIIYRLLGGSAQILFELVDPSTEFTPTITKRHYSQNKLHRVVRRAAPTTPNTIGLLFSSTYNYRNTLEQGNGTGYFQYGISATTKGFYFSDGKKVPNGTYKLLVRGLKFYGDETVRAIAPCLALMSP